MCTVEKCEMFLFYITWKNECKWKWTTKNNQVSQTIQKRSGTQCIPRPGLVLTGGCFLAEAFHSVLWHQPTFSKISISSLDHIAENLRITSPIFASRHVGQDQVKSLICVLQICETTVGCFNHIYVTTCINCHLSSL